MATHTARTTKEILWISWKCIDRNCRATVCTRNDVPSKIGQPHNHLPDHASVNSRKILETVRSRCRSETTPIPSIYDEEITKLKMHHGMPRPWRLHKNCLPSKVRDQHSIVPDKNYPGIPNTRPRIQLEGKFRQTTSREPFLQADVGDINKLLIFTTAENLRQLCPADTVYCDGTFYTAPPIHMTAPHANKSVITMASIQDFMKINLTDEDINRAKIHSNDLKRWKYPTEEMELVPCTCNTKDEVEAMKLKCMTLHRVGNGRKRGTVKCCLSQAICGELDKDAILYLLQQGGIVNALDICGRSSIYKIRTSEIIQIFIDFKTDFTVKDSFTNTVVKWPGATHDAVILANSNIPTIMEGQNGWLLGDSGYGLKKWLMTPLMNPNSQQEIGYNKSHCKTRNTVERAFGVLKARFSCLHKTGGSLQSNPPKCCKMIGACFRLHNKACSDGLPVPEDVDIQQLAHHNIINDDQQNNEANAIRRRLIQRF
ncbi:HARBI1 [Mytilus coruscus]|uniref:HARBI1 n=1 Tax=Mytilus coruscus TaxID=42192 RepID=A0A6J8DXH3_MYTCO|nr:HARBI1 [Mytilus coruscus]